LRDIAESFDPLGLYQQKLADMFFGFCCRIARGCLRINGGALLELIATKRVKKTTTTVQWVGLKRPRDSPRVNVCELSNIWCESPRVDPD
jgi:hypothetical protein